MTASVKDIFGRAAATNREASIAAEKPFDPAANAAALHESYTAELDAADEADAIAAKMFARA